MLNFNLTLKRPMGLRRNCCRACSPLVGETGRRPRAVSALQKAGRERFSRYLRACGFASCSLLRSPACSDDVAGTGATFRFLFFCAVVVLQWCFVTHRFPLPFFSERTSCPFRFLFYPGGSCLPYINSLAMIGRTIVASIVVVVVIVMVVVVVVVT